MIRAVEQIAGRRRRPLPSSRRPLQQADFPNRTEKLQGLKLVAVSWALPVVLAAQLPLAFARSSRARSRASRRPNYRFS